MIKSYYSFFFSHSAGLRCCSSTSGMLHRADWRRLQGVAGMRAHGRTGCQPVRGGMNALAARSTITARSASAPYQMAQTGGDVRPCYIFHMNSCNATAINCIHYCNLDALFDGTCCDVCLNYFVSNSVNIISLINNMPLQLGSLIATICGQGGNRRV